MSLTAALLTPLLLLISAAGVDEEQGDLQAIADDVLADANGREDAPEWPLGVVRSFEPDSAWQVHIEQRMIIRIAPRATAPVRRETFAAVPQRSAGPRFEERKIGKCLPASGIAGVEPNGGNSLLLFMRDRRMINAELDRSCRSRAFYSGFYLSRSQDGKICVDRDTLLSRSGTACKLSRIRQLVERED
jgi:hypothetical protein